MPMLTWFTVIFKPSTNTALMALSATLISSFFDAAPALYHGLG
jgi:hypothetical protein